MNFMMQVKHEALLTIRNKEVKYECYCVCQTYWFSYLESILLGTAISVHAFDIRQGFLPIHCAAVAGDCTKLSLLLDLDSSTGGKMREALADEMAEVHIC